MTFISWYQGAAFSNSATTPEVPVVFHSSWPKGFQIVIRSYELCQSCNRIIMWNILRPRKFSIQQSFIMMFPCLHPWCVIKWKIFIIILYTFLSDYILVFSTHLFGVTKVFFLVFLFVFFIVFNISKLLLFCISLICIDGMLCFTFGIQAFVFATTHLPQLTQSSLVRYILTDLFI